MPKKIREIKAILKEAGFVARLGKGSHSNWKHPLLVITVARKDGDDAPRYLEQGRSSLGETQGSGRWTELNTAW